jgi:hypothetical protein
MRSIALLLLVACAPAEGDPSPAPRARDGGPLVLELFTSQGCSSCPPADRLLSRLARDPSLAPLAFHVDYWDDLGWADPFASAAWTERQRAYARALGDKVYTPELVVGGAAGMVGSSEHDIDRAIAAAPRPARLAATARWRAGAVDVTAAAPADAEVFVAVWQDGLSTDVARGENAGRTLAGDRVVRRLARVAGPGERDTVTVALDARWRAGGAVVFAQRRDLRIVATAVLAP